MGFEGESVDPLEHFVFFRTFPVSAGETVQGEAVFRDFRSGFHMRSFTKVPKRSVAIKCQDFSFGIEVIHLLVDAAATALCLNPGQFDVMVMENMFGDILSDQGGGILGSLGLMPSACIGPDKSYYEPSHGSAPDIAGKNIANPYSMIGSVAMMLEMSFGMNEEAGFVWQAMRSVFESGYSTADLSKSSDNIELVTTDVFGDLVMAKLEELI